MKSKKEIIQSVEYIFENTKRIHGNSEAIDWQNVAIHKSVEYILSLPHKGEWWISHNIVGSGEPVKDWIEREFNKLDNETWREEPQTCLNCKNAGICDDDFECKWEPIKTE